MQIRQLMDQLKKMHPDAEVYVGFGWGAIDEIHKISKFNKYFGECDKNGKDVIISTEEYEVWDSRSKG